jgi:hypothetical protein
LYLLSSNFGKSSEIIKRKHCHEKNGQIAEKYGGILSCGTSGNNLHNVAPFQLIINRNIFRGLLRNVVFQIPLEVRGYLLRGRPVDADKTGNYKIAQNPLPSCLTNIQSGYLAYCAHYDPP